MNPFDQFDAEIAAGGVSDNPFDKFDKKQASSNDKRTWDEFGKDVALSAVQGLDMLAKLPAMAYDKATTGNWYGPETQGISAMSDEREKLKSAESQAKNQAKAETARAAGEAANEYAGGGRLGTAAQVASEFGVSFWESMKDPASIPEFVAQQAAQIGLMGKVGRGAEIAAHTAAKAAPTLAATKAGQAVLANSGTAGAVGFGATLQGVDVGSDTMQRLVSLPEEKWAQNPDYVTLSGQIGAGAAKQQIASRLAEEATLKAGAVSLATAALPGGASVERALVGKNMGGMAAVPRAFVGEAAQEGAEEGSGKYFSNTGVREIDAQQEAFEGVGAAAGQGAYMGGILGAGIHAGSSVMDRRPRLPDTGPMSRAANKAMDSGAVNAGDVLGVPAQEQSPVGGLSGAVADSMQPVDAGAQALADVQRQPATLSGPDRVREIETRLAELQTTDPSSPEAAALAGERDQITASWPQVVGGSKTSFSTESGARLDARYALMDASQLVTSHDEQLRPSSSYPKELQPRERDRAASEMQISSITQRLDPARLGESADSATGAPIVGADGLVESGNARSIALKRVYSGNPEKAAAYRQFLQENAQRFGLDPQAVSGMQNPVLVRVRETPVDRVEFARQANASTVAQMSPSEQARADAGRLDTLDDLRPTDDGDFMSSRDFIRRFIGRLPGTEQAGMIDAKGQLSQAGYTRVRNAIMAKAYGDSPALTRMVESLDDNLRNIGKALMRAAPDVAKMRADITDGALFEADITPDLLSGVETLSRLKDEGRSVAEVLSQGDMLGGGLSPEARQLLAFMDENIRRPRRIAEFIQRYTEALRAAGNPNQGSLLSETQAPSKRDIINAAWSQANESAGQIGQQQSGQPQGNPGSGQKAGEQRGIAQGGSNGAQGGDAVAKPETALSFARAEVENSRGKKAPGFVAEFDNKKGGKGYIELSEDGGRIYPAMVDNGLFKPGESTAGVVSNVYEQAIEFAAQQGKQFTSGDSVTVAAARIYEGLARRGHQVVKNPSARLATPPEVVTDRWVTDDGTPVFSVQKKAQSQEWVIFPPETGTLGIPRAEMPQVKGEHRGALISFLKGQGISYDTRDMPADDIKPTQAEFSIKKASRWGEVRDGVDRSVLVSSDGYILDGHHQWVAALSSGESVQVIQFDAPINKLLAEVYQFPSVQRSESGVTDERRSQAREDFKEALADLGAILRDFAPVARMVPENTPGLMPTLVRLFEAGLVEVGYNIKDLIAYVKKLAKKEPATKAVWNKISDDIYRKAARQAIDQALTEPRSAQAQGDLFAEPVAPAHVAGQADLFANMPAPKVDKPAAPKVAMIDGRPYDMKRDNFKPPLPPEVLTPDQLRLADDYIEKYYKPADESPISEADRAKAEAALRPLLKLATDAKPDYDQKIIDIAKRAGAKGQMIAPIKSIKRAAEKTVLDYGGDASSVKDLLRSTIVVDSYGDVPAIAEEIRKEFDVVSVKDKLSEDARNRNGGYSDYTVFVRMENGALAEIQINTPPMLSIKEHQGHKLYEAARQLHENNKDRPDIYKAMREFYDAAFAAGSKTGGLSLKQMPPLGAPGLPSANPVGSNSAPSSENLNHLPSGNITNSSPLNVGTNKQPAGNSAGTFISSTSELSIAEGQNSTYTDDKGNNDGVANEQRSDTGARGTQGQEPGAVQGTADAGRAERLPGREGGRDSGRDPQPGTGDRAGARVQPTAADQSDGSGRRDEDGQRTGPGRGARRNARIPAARDIPAKTGRNYAFGDTDLTYEGSWLVKARQNVEALELLKQLEKEGRQASKEEQAKLAKFIGWGASDLANSLFGDKLDKQIQALEQYDQAMAAMERHGKGYLTNRDTGFYQAFMVINAKEGGGLQYYSVDRITKERLTKAKPDAAARKWAELRDRIKAALTPDEWKEASRSTQYAHYTSKQRFIDQALSGDSSVRSIDDLSESSQFQIATAMTSDDKRAIQLAGLRAEIEKLQRLYRAHEEQRAKMRQEYDWAGETIRINERKLPEAKKAADRIESLNGDNFRAKADGRIFDTRKEFGEALMGRFKAFTDKLGEAKVKIGEISGFDIIAMGRTGQGNGYEAGVFLDLPEPALLTEAATADPVGVALKATNALAGLGRQPAQMQQRIEEAKAKRNALEARITAPFPMAEMLADKMKEAQDLETAMLADQNKVTGIEREQQLEDLWQQKTGAITPLFSRGTGAGMSIRDLSAVVARVSKHLKNLPRVHVLESPAGLSTKDPAQKSLRDFIRKAGAWNDVEGATHEGEIYLFAPGLSDEARAEHVLAVHEVTHYGFRGAVGEKRLDAALQEIWVANASVRKAAAALKERFGLESNVEATEEVLADMRPGELVKLVGWRRLVKVVRDWLSRAGFERLAARFDAWMKAGMTDQEKADVMVADLVTAAREWVRNGKGRPFMGGTRLADGSLADDLAEQEKWLTREAKARGFKTIDELADKNYQAFENLAKLWREKHQVDGALLSRKAGRSNLSRSSQTKNQATTSQRADEIISNPAASWKPVDTIMRTLSTTVRLDRLTSAIYDRAGQLLDRYVPEEVKAGVVSDYGIPEAVIDQRTLMQGRMLVQLRKTGNLIDKLGTLTRAESRIAYEWMNNADPQAAAYFEAQLPPESLKAMEEVKGMIDALSQEAVALGQLDPEAFKRNRFEYLRRSYIKHTTELTKAETRSRKRSIAIMGEQYKGRGMSDAVDMAKFKNVAPEWWGRKLKEGQADKRLRGEKFIRLERRAPTGEGVMELAPAAGPGNTNPQPKGRLLEAIYWPAGEAVPAKYSSWDQAGTWEVRDTKGGKLIVWRDFTKQERVAMGEIDEARYAMAKTLHGMIHDVETGRYLEWVGKTYGKKPGDLIDGDLVEASDRMRDVFKPGEWVQVPETKIPGTNVLKYGKLAGRIIPGPIWNDVRQTVGFKFKPLGETYAAILGAWKTAKTALSPAVHTNNIMANMVMADWHDVGAGHVLKALRIILGASQRQGKGIIGRTGNALSRAGIVDAEAAREIMQRYGDSGANLGSWVTAELQREQLEPLLEALEKEIGIAGQTVAGEIGVMAALQKAMQLRFPSAWDAFKPTLPGRAITTEARSMIDLYEAEDQVFRLAAWLKAKEDGASDLAAGKIARRSFLDYNINAPWVQALRNTVLPFISFTYRAVPMLLETAARKPHKLMKLGLVAGSLNALGYMLSGGDEDDERALLPEEKAGSIFGMVPKLIRMPWNDEHGAPVFLDIRRFVPVGDIFDLGATHAAVPMLPFTVPGGPLALMSELVANKSQFTGKEITLETDTAAEKAAKVADHLYKAFAPNIIVLPGTHAWTGLVNAGTGKTDAFGREQSPAQVTASAFGVKLGSYPQDVLQLNAQRATQAKLMEIDRNIAQLKRERQRNGIDDEKFREKVDAQMAKKLRIVEEFRKKVGGG